MFILGATAGSRTETATSFTGRRQLVLYQEESIKACSEALKNQDSGLLFTFRAVAYVISSCADGNRPCGLSGALEGCFGACFFLFFFF